jgi:hypothetical protein
MPSAEARVLSCKYVAAALATCLLAMGLLQLRVPYLNELATHMMDAGRIWRGEIDCTAVYRLPLGYAGYISPFVVAFGEAAGVKFANMFVLAGLLAAALALFQQARAQLPAGEGTWRPPFGLAGAPFAAGVMLLMLTAYPYTILNVARTTEALPAAALVVAVLWMFLRAPGLLPVVAVALCIGLGTHVRANMVSLLAPAVVWIALRGPAGLPTRAMLAAFGVVVAAAAYMAYSLLLSGCVWYSPTNGGYNLFAGNNPFSAAHFAAEQNGEYSLTAALAEQGMTVTEADAFYVPQETYIALAKRFVLDCPSCAIKLALQKTVVFFSPRLLNATSPVEIAAQFAVWLPMMLALCLALWRFVRYRGYLDGMLLLLFAAYALPFIVTNADPRMRFPLDIAALCYLGLQLDLYLRARGRWSNPPTSASP